MIVNGMIKNIFSKFKKRIIASCILSAMGAASGIAMLALLTEEVARFESSSSSILGSFWLFVVSVFVVVGFNSFSQYILTKISASMVYDIRDTLLKKVLGTEYRNIEKIGANKIIATMITDVGALSSGLLALPAFVFSVVTLLLCFFYMAYLSLSLFLLVVVLIIIIFSITLLISNIGIHYQKIMREYDDEFFSNLSSLTLGAKEICLNVMRRRQFYRKEMIPIFSKLKSGTVTVNSIFLLLDNITSALIFFLAGGVIYGAKYFLPEIGLHVVVGFVLIILYMIDPLQSLVSLVQEIGKFLVSCNKIENISLNNEGIFEKENSLTSFSSGNCNHLKINNLQYRYTDDKSKNSFSLGPIDIEFRSGELIFFTGANGSGKSTFSKLVAGLYKPDAGEIIVDGKILGNDIDYQNYRNLFTCIFSDFYLFDQYIDCSGLNGNDDVLKEYITELQLEGVITTQEGRLSTTDVSTGQRKRLSLIQSYLDDRPIFIFDEWAAEQDPEFRTYFYTHLLQKLKDKGKIVIVVTHNDRFCEVADKVIRFEDGVLISNDNKSVI